MKSNRRQGAFFDYVAASDAISGAAHIRDFRQILGEHASHMINVALHYGASRVNSKMSLLQDQERLTDLHQEWAERVTRPGDPREWKSLARQAVRSHSHCAMQLIGCHAESGATSIAGERYARSLELAADFHANLDPDARTAQNGDLHLLWKRYGQLLTDTIEALAIHGPESNEFYQRAANCINAAMSLGSSMDTLTPA